ncbi:immunity 22 family protein [Pimelobacter simplex]|uniref:immunity 22 family protein n=1 Tax=Nocardioides simplex TaxID=2045 RepID=UPI003AAC43DD
MIWSRAPGIAEAGGSACGILESAVGLGAGPRSEVAMGIVERWGVVSLWGGGFATEDDFFGYVEMIRPDGCTTSGFLRDSGIGFYDEDFAEGSYVSSDLDAAIRALSYGASFHRPAYEVLRRMPGTNAVYAIYDVDASGLAGAGGRLALAGAFPYQRSASHLDRADGRR